MAHVGLGLVSCGGMGTSLAQAAVGLESCRMVCVTDPVAEKATALAAQLGCDHCPDTAALLARDDVDAVIIAAPNHLHKSLALDAAAAGKHILCEKPMALNAADAQAMIGAADAASVKLMIAQVLRYLPTFAFLKELVDSGELGEPFAMQTTRIGGGWAGGGYATPWRMSRETCGGPLFEVSIHEIDFMRHILGDAEWVTAAMGHHVVPDIDYEDTALLLIGFRGGREGQLLAGHSAHLGTYDGKIFLTKGTAYFTSWPNQIRYRAEGGEEQLVDPDTLRYEPGVQREVREFVECVLNDTPPTIPGEEGLRNVEIAEAALISATDRRLVTLPL